MGYTNTTSISGPGSNPFGQISSAMAPIYSMFGSPSSAGNLYSSGGFGSGPSGYQPLPGSGDPMTATLRSMNNLMATGGISLFNQGGNMINQGTDVTGAGVGVEGGALAMLQQPYQLLSALASGDPSAMTSFAAPLANTLATQSNVAGTMADESSPMGGARAVAAAGRPQTLASTIGQSELGYQQQALQGLMGIANQVAGIGSNIAGTGQQIAGTGTTMTGQGAQMEQNTAADLLNKLQLNYQFGGPQTFATLMSPITQGIGAYLGAKCWIARAIYGQDDMRWRWCRAYLTGPFCDSVFGRIVMWFYSRFGQRIALQVQKRNWLKRGLKPLFDMALDRALTFT